jgi:hypothetical protein
VLHGAVMKKTAYTLPLMLALLSLIFGTCFVNLIEANPEPASYEGWGINIISPENKTYFTNPVNLTLEFTHHFASGDFRYSLDGDSWHYLNGESVWYHYDYVKTAPETIPLNLADGSHIIVVKFRSNTLTFCANVTFKVDSVSPHLSIASPENMTYNAASIPLDFTAYRLSDIQYSLDGKPTISVVDEIVLSLSDGFHSLVYYGTTVDGASYVSDAVNFAVDTGPPEIEVLSIENKTYYTGDLSLSFSVSEPLVKMGYSLDGDRVVVDGNVSLKGLSWGSYYITVHGYDSVSGTYVFTSLIFFSVFPTGLVIASAVIIVIVAVVAVLLLVRKHKQ